MGRRMPGGIGYSTKAGLSVHCAEAPKPLEADGEREHNPTRISDSMAVFVRVEEVSPCH